MGARTTELKRNSAKIIPQRAVLKGAQMDLILVCNNITHKMAAKALLKWETKQATFLIAWHQWHSKSAGGTSSGRQLRLPGHHSGYGVVIFPSRSSSWRA